MHKILLAEDDNDMRRFLVKALEKAGYQVLSYDNGASAYDRLREEPFSLLLTDIVMPEMDGPTLLREMRGRNPDLKIIFVSGYAEEAFDKSLPENEQFAFLAKPFALSALIAKVKETMTAP